ncbi:MAG: hypothetical protein U0074_02765 [Kouleothrix sp.]
MDGITKLSADDLRAATARGERIVLLCLAEQVMGDFQLSVRPTSAAADHPLARIIGDEMGVVYYTDIAGRLSCATTLEQSPVPTAAAMLRDAIEIALR